MTAVVNLECVQLMMSQPRTVLEAVAAFVDLLGRRSLYCCWMVGSWGLAVAAKSMMVAGGDGRMVEVLPEAS